MSGSTKTTQQQQATSSNTIDPWSKGLLTNNYNTAQANAASLGTPYTGQLTAGFTPTQLQAQGVLSGVATNPTFQANNNNAIAGVQGVMSNPVQASTIAGSDLSQYMNPYTSNVINTTIADQERARQIAQTNDAAQATAAGAFGGSRSGVMGALTNDAYDRNTASLLAGLNQSNYGNALNAAQADAATRNNMGQFNAANTLNAAGQLASLNNNGLGIATQQGGILGAVGDAQQQQAQTEMSNAYNNWLQGKQLTLQQQNLLNSALGMIPVQQTINSSGTGTTTTSSNPGLGGILGGLGSLALGVGSMGTGSVGASLLGL